MCCGGVAGLGVMRWTWKYLRLDSVCFVNAFFKEEHLSVSGNNLIAVFFVRARRKFSSVGWPCSEVLRMLSVDARVPTEPSP